MYDIVTIGSATVDVFVKTHRDSREILKHAKHTDVCMPLGAKVLVDDVDVFTGGGGTNTAVAFSRLGFKTAWMGALGNDANGQSVRDALRKERVTVHAQTFRGRTGYSVVLVGLQHDRTILAYKGVNDLFSQHSLPKTSWLYCSAMLGKSWKTLVKTVLVARRAGVRVAFNPSLYLAKKGMRTLASVIKHLDILVLNKEEAAALLKKTGTADKLAGLLAKHVRIAVVTDGARGAVASDGYFAYVLKPRKARVVETTGAGDAFASGFVAGQMLRMSIPDSLKLGQAEAAGVLSAIGAKNNLLTKKEALRAMQKEKVTVTAL